MTTKYKCPSCGSAMQLRFDEKTVDGKNVKKEHIFTCTNTDCLARYDESALRVINDPHVSHEM